MNKITPDYARKWREKNNYSQEYVAEQIEVSRVTYSNWETGKSKMHKRTMECLKKLVEETEEAEGNANDHLFLLLAADLHNLADLLESPLVANETKLYRYIGFIESQYSDLANVMAQMKHGSP